MDLRIDEAKNIAHIGSFDWDLVTDTLVMSDELYKFLKIDSKKFNGKFNTIVNLIHPEDKEYVLEAIDSAIKNNKFPDIEHRMLLKNKKEIFVHTRARPFYDKSNKPYKMIGPLWI